MAGFRIIKNIVEAEGEDLKVSSQTVAVGDLLERTAGSVNWAVCTASTDYFTPKAIADQAVSSSATSVHAIRLNGLELVAVEGNEATSVDDNGDRMALTDKNTVANTSSDVSGQAVAFVQEGIISSTEIVGHVLVGNGVDPDAA